MRVKGKSILLSENRLDRVSLLIEIMLQFDSRLTFLTIMSPNQLVKEMNRRRDNDHPAIAFLSHHIPDLNALEILQPIIREPLFLSVPVYIIGEVRRENIESYWKEKGASDYIQWPSRPSELKAALAPFFYKFPEQEKG